MKRTDTASSPEAQVQFVHSVHSADTAGALGAVTEDLGQVGVPAPAGDPPTVRRELARAGGLAGAHWLAARMASLTGEEVSVRMVRDRFRNIGSNVRKLGAGYYAMRDHPAPPLNKWAAWWIHARGPTPVPELIEAILKAYPYGDAKAVHAWIYQDPSPLLVVRDVVYLVPRKSGE